MTFEKIVIFTFLASDGITYQGIVIHSVGCGSSPTKSLLLQFVLSQILYAVDYIKGPCICVAWLSG